MGGGWLASRPGRLTPGKEARYHCTGGGVGLRPVWTGAENLASSGFDPQTFQPIASHYADCGNPAQKCGKYGQKLIYASNKIRTKTNLRF